MTVMENLLMGAYAVDATYDKLQALKERGLTVLLIEQNVNYALKSELVLSCSATNSARRGNPRGPGLRPRISEDS